jgi:hypothetical protein
MPENLKHAGELETTRPHIPGFHAEELPNSTADII